MSAALSMGCAGVIGALAGTFLPATSRVAAAFARSADDAPESEAAGANQFDGPSLWVAAVATAGFAVACSAAFGVTWKAVFAFGFLFVLCSLAAIDHKTLLLPDVLTVPLTLGGLLVNSTGMFVSFREAAIGCSVGYMCLWSLYWAVRLVTGKEGMGFGDVKLGAALGAWLGGLALPHVLAVAAFLASAYGSFLLLRRAVPASHFMAFGPFLAISGGLTILVGTPLYSLLMP